MVTTVTPIDPTRTHRYLLMVTSLPRLPVRSALAVQRSARRIFETVVDQRVEVLHPPIKHVTANRRRRRRHYHEEYVFHGGSCTAICRHHLPTRDRPSSTKLHFTLRKSFAERGCFILL